MSGDKIIEAIYEMVKENPERFPCTLTTLEKEMNDEYLNFVEKMLNTDQKGKVSPAVQHAVEGIVTEAGELMDLIKKHKWYGRELPTEKLIDEAGDVLFYLTAMLGNIGSSLDEAIRVNERKLKARYGDKFSTERALKRDQVAEAAAMQVGTVKIDVFNGA